MDSKIATYKCKPIRIGGLAEPIVVKTAADVERVKQLVAQASTRGIEARFRAGVDWGLREGIRIGVVEGASASVDDIVEACFASPRARRQMTIVKDVERDSDGRVIRVVERPG